MENYKKLYNTPVIDPVKSFAFVLWVPYKTSSILATLDLSLVSDAILTSSASVSGAMIVDWTAKQTIRYFHLPEGEIGQMGDSKHVLQRNRGQFSGNADKEYLSLGRRITQGEAKVN